MDIEEAIKGRRSVRKYTDKIIEKSIIKKIVEAGQWAPTACNRQDFYFIVIDSPKIIYKIIQHGAANFLKNTKQAILVIYNNETDNLEYKDHIQSASAAIQNMLLRAYSLNVGSCWVNYLPRKNYLRKLLHIPKQYDPIALIALGYCSNESFVVPRKKELLQIISYNIFDFKDTHKKKNVFLLRVKVILRTFYFYFPGLPVFFRKLIVKWEKKFKN